MKKTRWTGLIASLLLFLGVAAYGEERSERIVVSREVVGEDGRVFEYERPVIGADISWVPSQEDRGMVFSDKGVEKDVLEILADNRFNWIRLRLFVDPTAEKVSVYVF